MLNNARPHQSRHRDVRPSQRVKLQVNSLRVLKLENRPGTKRILHFLDPECREEFGSIRVGQRMWRRRRRGAPHQGVQKSDVPEGAAATRSVDRRGRRRSSDHNARCGCNSDHRGVENLLAYNRVLQKRIWVSYHILELRQRNRARRRQGDSGIHWDS